MRYAFVVNPVAGKGNHENGIISSIENVIADNFDADIGLYMTKGNKEAISLSETLADEAMKAGDEIVVFACGGDGTAFEVANGIYGYDNAMLGLVPIGRYSFYPEKTANTLVKRYTDEDIFED